MKVLDVLKTSNTNLFRSPLRTALTVLAIFIGTLTLTLTTGLGSGVRDFVNKQLSSVSAPGIISIIATGGVSENPFGEPQEYNPEKKQQQTVSTTSFSQTDIDKIKQIENIKNVYPVYVPIPEYITKSGEKKYTLSTLDQQVEGFETPLAAGRVPDPNKNEEILLSYRYLEILGFNKPEDAIGQKVSIAYKNILGEIKEREYTVVGVLINSITGSLIRVNLIELQEMSKWQLQRDPGAFALVAMTDPDLPKDKFDKVKKDLREKGYVGTSLEDQVNQINTIIDTIQTVLNSFAIIVIVAGGIGIINTLLMSVYERTREIGLMKALGMKSNEVFSIFAIEAVLIGFWGGLFGILAGIGLGYVINYFASITLLKDLQGFNLMAFPLIAVLPILLGTMVVGLLAGTLPAIKASLLNPIEALRYE